jgi:SAM-dependent methyltransferase
MGKSVLQIDGMQLRRLRARSVLRSVIRQFWREWQFHRRHGRSFRVRDPHEAIQVYAQMTPEEFDALNARQSWANWRTIPQALANRLPSRPLVAVDLGAGTGHSTEVLACFLPPGSRILGLEGAGPLLEVARRRVYRHRAHGNEPAVVVFRCQNVLDPWRWPDGSLVDDESVDLVNSCGLIGHHFSAADLKGLLTEVIRVLRPGGLACLDPGPAMPPQMLAEAARRYGLVVEGRVRSHWLDRCGLMLFRRPGIADQVRCNGVLTQP